MEIFIQGEIKKSHSCDLANCKVQQGAGWGCQCHSSPCTLRNLSLPHQRLDDANTFLGVPSLLEPGLKDLGLVATQSGSVRRAYLFPVLNKPCSKSISFSLMRQRGTNELQSLNISCHLQQTPILNRSIICLP